MPSSLLEAVSSGPKTRKLVMLRRITSARKVARVAVEESSTCAGFFDRYGVVAEVRQLQRLAQQAAVGVRVGGDAARACGRHRCELRDERAVVVEELFRLVAAHPAFDQLRGARDL